MRKIKNLIELIKIGVEMQNLGVEVKKNLQKFFLFKRKHYLCGVKL